MLAITTSGLSIRWTIPFCTGMFPFTMFALTEPLLCFLVPQVVMDSTTGTKGWDHCQSLFFTGSDSPLFLMSTLAITRRSKDCLEELYCKVG